MVNQSFSINQGKVVESKRNHLFRKPVAILTGLIWVLPVFAQDINLVEKLHTAEAEHVNQKDLYHMVQRGEPEIAFETAFELGDELFEVTFNSLDGVGANVGEGMRFSRIPRADLNGADEWANHFPKRETGPNGRSCLSCHNVPFADGGGETSSNVHRDPTHSGMMSRFIQRNATHMFGSGAIQRAAEEMTEELHARRDYLQQAVCGRDRSRSLRMRSKGVDFGRLIAHPLSSSPCRVSFDTAQLEGIDDDLVVKPFQWKGSEKTLRTFNAGAFHNELGMQPVETVGYDQDGDFDGVSNEITIGDQTAMAIYLAAQPRPTTKLELERLNLIALSKDEKRAIRQGRRVFGQAGCTGCHKPRLKLDDAVFSEPSQNKYYRDDIFPSGLAAVSEYLDPAVPVTFDLTADQPDNQVDLGNGEIFHLGALQKDLQGRAIVNLFGDLKRHDMGAELAEPVDETGTGAATFITKELWGVGSTAPYLHDGRATTLAEAILAHGGEAQASRRLFRELNADDQQNLIAFLENLVIVLLPDDDEEDQDD